MSGDILLWNFSRALVVFRVKRTVVKVHSNDPLCTFKFWLPIKSWHWNHLSLASFHIEVNRILSICVSAERLHYSEDVPNWELCLTGTGESGYSPTAKVRVARAPVISSISKSKRERWMMEQRCKTATNYVRALAKFETHLCESFISSNSTWRRYAGACEYYPSTRNVLT